MCNKNKTNIIELPIKTKSINNLIELDENCVVWQCLCGNSTFYILQSCEIECSNCGNIQKGPIKKYIRKIETKLDKGE